MKLIIIDRLGPAVLEPNNPAVEQVSQNGNFNNYVQRDI